MWFGQKEFAQKEKDDDQFADQYPLPREGLAKTKAHIQRVKALKAQAKATAKEDRILNNLRDEHKFGSIQIVREDNQKKENQLIKQGFGKVEEEEIKDIEIVKKEESEEYYFDEYSLEEEEEAETELVEEEKEADKKEEDAEAKPQ